MAIPLILLALLSPVSAADLKGIILDDDDGNAIPGAVVEIEEIGKQTTSSPDGYFTLPDIPDGYYTLTISRLGYYQNQLSIELTGNNDGEIAVYLRSRPLEIAPVVVTTQHSHSKFEELSELSHTLKGKELQRDLGMTLASTLKNETGLAMRSMGPAPARPVIRGLGGDRVTISEDGNKTIDLSATSPDHAVTIEPFSLERIEVIRGPKALRQTSTTFGGVVNAIRHEIPQDLQHKISGSIGTYGETANRGFLKSATLTVPYNRIQLKGEISHKNASDLDTPVGELENSYAKNLDYSLAGSYIGKRGFIGVSYHQYDLDYGIPGGFVGAHPNGVDIEMFKRQINFKGRFKIDDGAFDNIETHFARVYYRHKEFEAADVIGTEFKIVDYLGYTDINHKQIGIFANGTFGLAYDFRDLDLGGLIFSPPSRSLNISPYVIENIVLNKLNLEFGLRYNYSKIKPDHDNPNSRIGYIRSRAFHSISASLSALYEVTDLLSIGGNISRSTRVPTLEELFSEGPHLAAYSFETGNPDLKTEQGYGIETFVYLDSDRFYAMANLFYNDLENYIIHRNTGEINWTTVLPIYAAMNVDARLYGFENQIEYRPVDKIAISGSLSYTRGEFRESGSPLPQIPPFKGQVELAYVSSKIEAGMSSAFADKQDQVDEFEEPTDGYTIFNAYMQYTLSTGLYIHTLSMNIDNILDREYRNHLSRVKSILPEAGRNLRITYKMFFEL